MSRLFIFGPNRDWLAANWAAEHTIRLMRRFLPEATPQEVGSFLDTYLAHGDVDFTEIEEHWPCLRAALLRAIEALSAPHVPRDLFLDHSVLPRFRESLSELLGTISKSEKQ